VILLIKLKNDCLKITFFKNKLKYIKKSVMDDSSSPSRQAEPTIESKSGRRPPFINKYIDKLPPPNPILPYTF
jgi:hypothetical protein